MGTLLVDLDCSAFRNADLRQVDALARLSLELRRNNCELRLANVGGELADLIGFAGLAGVLGVEARGQAEEREDPLGVEEEGEV